MDGVGGGVGPLVSVVIPCFNQAAFLGEAVCSALGQSYKPVEVGVVDDGSDQDLIQVIAPLAGVQYVRQPNRGVSDARNTGFSRTHGRFVVFLDADDRLAVDAIARGMEVLARNPDALAAVGLCRVVGPTGEPQPFRQRDEVGPDAYLELLRENFIWMPAQVLHRRAAFEESHGFDPSVNACADYDLYLRLARVGRLVCHRHVVADYRQHGQNMSRDPALMLASALTVLERQTPHVREHPRYRGAQAVGRRFWKDFYGECVVEEIRAQVKTRGRRRAALRAALILLRYDPGRFIVHAGRKFSLLTRGIRKTRA